MTEKKKTRVLSVLLVISLAAAVIFGVRAHQLSDQKDRLGFSALNSQLNYVKYVLVIQEEPYHWGAVVNLLSTTYPWDVYEIEDRGDNQEIVNMLLALQNVWYEHPNRDQIVEGLKGLRVASDTETKTFTILEGDAEAITELCKQQQ